MTKAGRQPNIKFGPKAKTRKPWIPLVAGAAVVVVVVGSVWWVKSASQGPQLGQEFANQGQEHIAFGAKHAAYNSFPATSGPHYLQPTPWGTYSYEIDQEPLVHNLEHGGVVIQYNPDLLNVSPSKLKAVQAQFPNKTVVAPNSKLKVALALTSWRRLYTLDTFDEPKIVDFIKQYKNHSPELFPD